ncbi:MAG: hypothetical protein PHR68_00205 [Candidatus Gracilibacteria bacterium]|nr:hypothetical protein [Candidatus Gracilibacteria bacterium]
MQTIEAVLDKNKVSFENIDFIPKGKTRVLITFLEDNTYDLVELENDEISIPLLKGQKEVLEKDKAIFTNI